MLADKSKSKETLHTKLFQNVYTMRKEKETLNAMKKRKTFIFEKKGKKAHVPLSGTTLLITQV
jgi:hypothetical protein